MPGAGRCFARLKGRVVGRISTAGQICTKLDVSDGAQGRNRTTDTVIFSHVLYQLSYLGSRDRAGRPSKRRAPYLSLSSLSTPAGSAGGPAMR